MVYAPLEVLAQTAALAFQLVFLWKTVGHVKRDEMPLATICLFIGLLGFVLVQAV